MCLLRHKYHIKLSLRHSLLIALFINISERIHQTWWPKRGFVKSEDEGMTLCVCYPGKFTGYGSLFCNKDGNIELIGSFARYNAGMGLAQGSLPEILSNSASCQYRFVPSHQMMMRRNKDSSLLIVICLVVEQTPDKSNLRKGYFCFCFQGNCPQWWEGNGRRSGRQLGIHCVHSQELSTECFQMAFSYLSSPWNDTTYI